MRREVRRLGAYCGSVGVLSILAAVVIGREVLPLMAWAIILYPVFVLAWWFARSSERFRPTEHR